MKKILIIEDESALQKAFGDILSQEGCSVVSALDGETGLKLANPQKGTSKPDLILLDLVLPKVNGFEVLKQLKSQVETKDIPVIVLTNLEGVEDIDRVLSLGATTYLVKAQYSLDEIVGKVKEILK